MWRRSGWSRGEIEESGNFRCSAMSMRERAAQRLGKHLPDKSNGRLRLPSSRWAGSRARWHEDQEDGNLIQSCGNRSSVASEHIFRSRETVKAWLESSPTSVIENLEDESACSSSYESFSSSPAGSVEHFSGTSRFLKSSPGKVNSPGHTRSRTISPPRCTANRNSVDLSRIDYGGGSFLLLAFKNAQYHGSSSPPAFLYTSENYKDDHPFNADECCSPRSEFSVTSEWQYILAAANAAGMSTRDSSANNSDLETFYEVLNVSDFDINSAAGNRYAHLDVVSKPYRTQSLELPRKKRLHERSASGEVKSMLVPDKKYILRNDCTILETKQESVDITCGRSSLRRLSRRNLGISNSLLEAAEQGPKRVLQSNATFRKEVKLQNKPSIARSKAEVKKVVADVKSAEKYAGAVRRVNQSSKAPRGCLFLS